MDPKRRTDPRNRTRWRGFALLGAFCGLFLLGGRTDAQASASDPFQSGLRWSHAPDPSEPWIPRDVILVGDGEFTLAAPAVQNPMVQLFASAELASGAPTLPLFQSSLLTGAIGPVHLAAGPSPGELFEVAQFPAPSGSSRRTLVVRRDAAAAALGAGFAPRWSFDFGTRVNGPARIAASADGGVLLAGVLDAPSGSLEVVSLDPSDGSELWRSTLTAGGFAALEIARGGDRSLLAAGSSQVVLDAAGVVLFQGQDTSAPGAAAISGDGLRIALGGSNGVRVWEDGGAGYVPLWNRSPSPDEIAIHAAFSDDGGTLAVLWWNAKDAVGVRAEILAGATGTLLQSYVQSGAGVAGLQNFPIALAITPDGSRVALGLWGTGDGRPEVVLLERDGGPPVLEQDLPGSVEALALSPDGTRVAVARRDSHANLFSTTGSVDLFDTGERDLQLVGATRLGGSLDLEFLLPEVGDAVFALGNERATPGLLPLGSIWIDFRAPYVIRSVQGPLARASLSLAIPMDPGLIGAPFAAQAIGIGPSGAILASTVVRLRIL